MHTATTRLYSVSLTSWFAQVVPYSEASLPDIAKGILMRFGGYGLRPMEIVQREGDRLFDYDLSFSLFNRSGTIRLTAEGSHATFQNAKGNDDANLIADCLLGLGETLSGRRMREHRLEALVHASLASVAERDSFLASLGPADRKLPIVGCILSIPSDEPFGEGRIVLDRSVVFPDAVFINWSVQFSATPGKALFEKARAAFERQCLELGIQFPS